LAAAALSIAALAGVVDRNQKRPAAAFPKPGLATAAPNAQALEEGAALPEPASIPELAVATTRQASASLGGLSEEPGRRKTASPAMPGESTGRRTFVPAVSPPQAELEIPEPPTIAGAGAIEAGPTLGKDIVGVPRLSIPAAPDAFVRVTVDPVLPTRRWGRLGKLGLGGKGEKRTVFFPPTPVHRPATDVPPELSRRIGRNVPVDVKVYVDREGKVAYAELLSDAAGLDRDLVTLAVFSSRRWQFAPAQSDGENVAAEVVLRYRFGAGDR
jgi:hypothetical protein